MPTVQPEDYQGPYRFQFWSSDLGEPAHVHVRRDRADAKYWLEPVELAQNRGFKEHELTRIKALVVKYHSQLLEAWHEFFGH